MNFHKRLRALLLVLALILGLTIPAFAAVDDTGFSDVDADAWYAVAVMYCREHNLMAGTGNNQFAPENSLTRAQLATVLYRIEGSPAVSGTDSFTDTVPGAYYSSAILWASRQELMGGYGNGLFGPNNPVTREQMTAIFWRYAGSPTATGTAGFSDASAAASYAAPAIAWAEATGIVAPVSGNAFAPKSNATRAQVAAALMNYDKAQQSVPSTGSHILVAYFSRYGNTNYDSSVDATTSASVVVQDGQRQGTTELIARIITDRTGGTMHLIETAESYPSDFGDVVSRNHQEIADGTRPTLTSQVDMSGYDVIFVGYPVWASTAPTPVLAFLESYDLTGKTVIPFCTHDGYGAGSSYSAVERASSSATVERGLAIDASSAASAQGSVESWLNGLKLPQNGNRQPQRD